MLLKELFGINYDKLPDEELDKIILDSRLAREEVAPPKASRAKKGKVAKISQVDLDEYE